MVNRSGRRSPFASPNLAAFVIALIGCAVLGSCLALAQGFTATVTGTVTDTSGAVLPGTAISIKNLETGLTRAVEADLGGNYSIASLPVGEYELTAEKMGFQREVRRGINLVVAQEAVVNLTLQVGSIVQQVTVTEAAPLVNTTTTSTSGVITEQQIKELPLNGRSFDQLLTLNVGTVDNRSNINNGAWTSFSVAGKRPETNRFILNGVDYIGANATGQFITPSGSSVHGAVFEYLRNGALDARNYFENAKGPFKRNQFGGEVGGPLKKDKAFLFVNYEGFRERWNVPNVANVPDAQARLGNLPCYIVSPAAGCPNPAAYVVATNKTGTMQPGMLPYANYFWPAPNGPELLDPSTRPTGTAQAIGNPLRSVREDFGLLRFDTTISSKDSFSANFNGDDGRRGAPPADPVFTTLSTQRAYLASLQETHIFSNTIVNVATLGFSRAWGTQVNVPAPGYTIPSNLIFLPGTNPGSITIGGGTATVVAAALAQPTGNSRSRDTRNHVTGADDLHLTRGNHAWSAGVWIQRIQQNQIGNAQFTAGTANYDTLLAFLQDSPKQFLAASNPQPLYFRSTETGLYIQDEIKLKPNFTLRLGVREEMTSGWNEAHGHAANYLYDANGIVQTDPRIDSSAFLKNNAKMLWEPRIGLAWDPSGSGKWSVRAGFGIYNDLQDNLAHRLNADPPFNARLTLTTPLLTYMQNPIPFGTQPPPSCHTLADAGTNCSIFSPGGLDPFMHTPTLQQWSLTIQRSISQNLMVELSYVGSQAYHVVGAEDLNMAVPQVCSDPTGCYSGGINATGTSGGIPLCGGTTPCPKVPQGMTYLPATPPKTFVTTGTTKLTQRPNPFVGPMQSWFYNTTSSYHSGSVSLTKRATRGLAFKANYTFSKLLDIESAFLATSGANEPPTVLNPFDLNMNRGLASYNLKHQFNANFTYQLPFGRGQHFGGGAAGPADKVIGGWQWNGSITAQGGFPFTPTVGSNVSGTGDTQNPDVPNRNPVFNGPVVLGTDGFRTTGRYFDRNGFSLPLAGTFGNVARGSFIGPAFYNFDTSLFKNFSFTEEYRLQFRVEAFNLLNRTNFASPNPVTFSGNNYSSSAGVITQTANPSRQIQFALKLLF
ncbi:MAG: hypothetical protein DMG31_08910 [Acidobacteria bacterium]|nr:MAG: hypothetical protein DMG31_08910 [Acidobacteriota bacterium]